MYRIRAALPALALIVAISNGPTVAAQQPCRFVLGFEALRNLVGAAKVGECLEDERFNLENGNAEQRTTGGLLVWRKVDNFTAFTDGGTSWINGPNGLQSRPNADRFAWEKDPVQPAAAPAAAPPPAPAAPPPPAPVAQAAPKPAAPVAASAPAPKPVAKPAPEDPVKLSGKEKQKTSPFSLKGGNYTVEWRGDRGQFGGNLIVRLHILEGGTGRELLVNTIIERDDRSKNGETQLYNVPAGRYYLDVIAPDDWSVTFTPQ